MARHFVRIAVTLFGLLASVSAAPQPAGSLQGEAMYPRTSLEMWKQVQALAQSMKLAFEKKDAKRQMFVSKWTNYDQHVFPAIPALRLPGSAKRVRVQFHVLVTPGRDPARVAVGSIVEVDRQVDGGTKQSFLYRYAPVEDWFLRELDVRAGVEHERMAATIDGRREQAARLMPAGSADPCLSASATPKEGKITPPVKISDVQPIFPAEGFDAGEADTVLECTITEHGTLSNLEVVNPSAKHAFYETSARAATSLWRFEPTRVAECPVPTVMTITVHYRLQ